MEDTHRSAGHCAHCSDRIARLEGERRALMDELAATREQVRIAQARITQTARGTVNGRVA